MREHADAHVPIGVNCKTLQAAATGVHGAWVSGRLFDFVRQRLTVLIRNLRPVHIERNHILRREPYSQRGLRTVDPRAHQRVKHEFDSQFLLGELLHGSHFVPVDLGSNGL